MRRPHLHILMAASAALAFVAACEPAAPPTTDTEATGAASEAGESLENGAIENGSIENGARELGDEIERAAETAADAPREARDDAAAQP